MICRKIDVTRGIVRCYLLSSITFTTYYLLHSLSADMGNIDHTYSLIQSKSFFPNFQIFFYVSFPMKRAVMIKW